jgi:hypothetical protein
MLIGAKEALMLYAAVLAFSLLVAVAGVAFVVTGRRSHKVK